MTKGKGKSGKKASTKPMQKPAKGGPVAASTHRRSWLTTKLEEDLTSPHKGRYVRIASLIGFWLASVAAWLNLIYVSLSKQPSDWILPYPSEQTAAVLALIGSSFATYKLYLDEAGKALLENAKSAAEAGQVEARKDIYRIWQKASQIQDGAVCRMYRTQGEPDIYTAEGVIDALLESIKTIFDNVYPESEVLSVNLAVPDSIRAPTALKVLRRWPEQGGATIGRELDLGNTEGWGFVAAFNEREVKYLPDTKGTTSDKSLYNSVLNIPIWDGSEAEVVGVVNIDSRKAKAFGQSEQRRDERVDQALQLATPTIRLIALLLLDPRAFSHYRKR